MPWPGRLPKTATHPLLDRVPMLGDILRAAPDRLKQKLFDAFDIQALDNKTGNQVTLWATITPSTPAALVEIIADSETPELAALLSAQDHPSDFGITTWGWRIAVITLAFYHSPSRRLARDCR